jgi:hypothetical protein
VLRGAPAASTAELRHARDQAADLARRNEQLSRQAAALAESQKKSEEQLARLEQAASAEATASGARGTAGIQAGGATASPPPLGSVERGAPAGAAADLPREAPFTVLTLASNHAEGYDRYELAFVDAAGKEVRRLRDVHPEPASNQFVVSVPRGALARGSYTLRLYGVRDGQPTLLDSYAIRVD